MFLPTWQIEGLRPTYEESAITGEGRLHAGRFPAIVAEAARANRLDSVDRLNGGLIDWPGGHAPYAYGLGFHAFLVDTRHAAERLATLAEETSRRLPYTAFGGAFGHVYGRSLGDLWRDYGQSLLASNPPAAAPDAERLTHHGYVVVGPRFALARCQTCAAEIHYSIRTPGAFPALYRLVLDGSPPQLLTTRYLGSTTGSGAETIYFDQEERQREPGRYFDLYALDRASGRVRRVTEDARLTDPDLSPDGRSVVAVQSRPGQRNLVIVGVGPAAARAPTRDRHRRVGARHPVQRAAVVTGWPVDRRRAAPAWRAAGDRRGGPRDAGDPGGRVRCTHAVGDADVAARWPRDCRGGGFRTKDRSISTKSIWTAPVCGR